jgi:SAM-dependent methyltransferase
VTDPQAISAAAVAVPPAPVRNPDDERRRLVSVTPGHLLEVVHTLFAGRFDPRRPFRALFAGAATGDGCIMLAQQLARAGAAAAELVYADPSPAARAVAEARAGVRGLANLRFLTAPAEMLPDLELGRFDYVDTGTALSQAADPAQALAALAGLMAPGGGLGLSAPGAVGLTGVAPFREAVRQLGGPGGEAERLAVAERLARDLPPTNWLKRNPWATEHLGRGTLPEQAAALAALAEAPRAWRVEELAALAAAAGLRIVRFVEPLRYAPELLIRDPALRARLEGLDPIARAAFAEAFTGSIERHAAYAVAATRSDDPVARLDDGDPVPVLRGVTGEALARAIVADGGVLAVSRPGLEARLELPPLAAAIAARIDGRRRLSQIHKDLVAEVPRLDWLAFRAQLDPTFRALEAAGLAFLRA